MTTPYRTIKPTITMATERKNAVRISYAPFSKDTTIGVDDLFPPREAELLQAPAVPARWRSGAPPKRDRKTEPPISPRPAPRGRLSDDQIQEALERYGGPAAAARATGIHRTTFYRYMRRVQGEDDGGEDPDEDG
jgi:transcriptional regulator of acetoin/glycerol metabolism